jgi:hypothetical protein
MRNSVLVFIFSIIFIGTTSVHAMFSGTDTYLSTIPSTPLLSSAIPKHLIFQREIISYNTIQQIAQQMWQLKEQRTAKEARGQFIIPIFINMLTRAGEIPVLNNAFVFEFSPGKDLKGFVHTGSEKAKYFQHFLSLLEIHIELPEPAISTLFTLS